MGLWEAFLNWLRSLFFKQEMELSLIGLQNAGKTSLVNVIAVGFNMRKVTKGNVTIKLWDLGGQPRFRSMWERYCRAVSAIVYVVDAADFDNLSVSRSELHDLLSKPSLSGIPLLVLGNKIDKPGALSKEDFMEQIRGGQNRGPFGPNQATDIQADFQILSRGIACPLALIVALGMFLFSYFVMSIELLNALHQIDAYTIWQVQVNDFSPMSEAGDRHNPTF
ncbi:hypothetical protein NC653_003133 [Populus alba x Populus x berolinensis]|uniref:Uncharacterized protein n=1 Tax=Populus alba x Populus x berolinensis TaxID=444605 RepID=A0AAD6RQN5_9ROSI|nr:hypothetical protein NC653_003133 [Populus alba x Populus x berolinensis]